MSKLVRVAAFPRSYRMKNSNHGVRNRNDGIRNIDHGIRNINRRIKNGDRLRSFLPALQTVPGPPPRRFRVQTNVVGR